MTQTPEEKKAMLEARREAYPLPTPTLPDTREDGARRIGFEDGWQARSEWTPAPSVDVEQREQIVKILKSYQMMLEGREVILDNSYEYIAEDIVKLFGSRDLGQMEQWVSVDTKPPMFQNVLVYGSKAHIGIGCVMSNNEWDDFQLWEDETATHWMPLPESPIK